MNGFDFSKVEKTLVETFHFNSTTLGIMFGFPLGEEKTKGFLLPWPLAKILNEKLSGSIQEYEKKNGPIDTDKTTSGIQSPIQRK